MWSATGAAPSQRQRTFTETARRAQIVAAAIDTIAEVGYAQASLARIAERLKISKGVISYHFAGKDDLVREIVAGVVAEGEAFMRPRILAQSSAAAKLRAYIESNLAFMAERRNEMVALVEIARHARDADGRGLFDTSILARGTAELRQGLADAQSAGDLRADFDPAVMAMAIRTAIDAVPPRMAADPTLDVAHYGRELAKLFDLASRKEAS